MSETVKELFKSTKIFQRDPPSLPNITHVWILHPSPPSAAAAPLRLGVESRNVIGLSCR